MNFLSSADPEISQAIECEKLRQAETINLIASENYTSPAVLDAQGSFLTYKYAEGYPGRRYYGGCENMDVIENLAIERVKALFKAGYANVQPHSGSQANMAVYFAALKYGDTILAMNLAHGGHLTHGSPVTFSGRSYHFVHYGLNRETGRIDYPEVERLAKEHKPKLIVAGASAYPRIIDFAWFRRIADSVGAMFMVDIAHIAGLVAAGLHPSPVPYSEYVTSTTHKTLRGTRGGFILCRPELGKRIDSAVFPEMQGGPLMHSIAAKAVAFHEAIQPEFVEYQKAVLANAATLGDELQAEGLKLVSGGTDNHLVLVDLTDTGVTGKQALEALEAAGIVTNKNAVPFDTRPPAITSGIRLGTPAVTTRGFGIAEMKKVASMIVKIIRRPDDITLQQAVKKDVVEMCEAFPVPGINCH